MTYTIWSYIDLLSNVGVDFYGFRGVAFRMAFTESKYAFENAMGKYVFLTVYLEDNI